MQDSIYLFGGIGFVFFMTCLGASTVFFFRKEMSANIKQMFFGLAAGIMMAISVWSLLLPAIEQSDAEGVMEWLPAILGFSLGVVFLLGLDQVIHRLYPQLHEEGSTAGGSKRSRLIISAIILHNIPEGIAVGIAFAFAVQQGGLIGDYAPVIALAIGIGIHNFPEGGTVALLLRQEGLSRRKSFLLGTLSGAVDSACALITALLSATLLMAMPWLLAFAAGAMMFVVVEEMIPEARAGKHSHVGTISVMIGFLFMTFLDVVLG